LPESTLVTDFKSYQSSTLLLLASTQQSESSKTSTEGTEKTKYEDRMFTANKMHKYLGIGSVAAALLTVITPKEEDGAHEILAKTSALLGLGAVGTGFYYHYEDLNKKGGFNDPDNLHALWAGLGALGIAMAAVTGPDVPHATLGSLGAIGMIIGIKYNW